MSFKWHIENNTSDPERRLNHLYHILDGPPRNLVEHCLHLSPTIGYDEAWKQLSEFYGREVDATEAFIRQLLEWKEIPAGDSEGLMNYASYLKKVKAALGANYTRIELQETMRKIVEKLPHPLRVRWVSKYLEHEHKLPALITFVERQALVAKELKYYECDRRPSKGKPEDTSKPIKAKALPVHHSSPSDNGIYCVYCKKNKHGIQSCHRFQSLNLDDRWNAVVDAKLCFRCLNVAHNHEACEEESTCGKCGLGTHHTLLHYVKKTPSRDSTNSKRATVYKTSDKPKAEAVTTSNAPPDRTNTETALEAGTPATTGHVHAMSTDRRPDGRTMLKLIPVMVNGTCTTVGFIDGGAAPTLAARSLIDRLGVTGRPCNQTMVTEAGTFDCKEVVQLTLGNINGGEEEERVKEVFVTDKINVSTDYIMPSDWLKRWPHMADVELQSLPTDHEQVELVIGLDTTLNRVILEQRHGTANEPSAYLTKLGWVAFGPTGDRSASEVSPVHHVHRKFDPQDLTEVLQSHFNRDFFEKESLSKLEDSLEDKRFLATLNNTTQHRHGKYVAKLPFKDSTPLPDNMNMAIRRARSLKRRLDNDEAYKTSYVAQMEKYTDKGYAERVPVSQLDREDGRVWLMPHHSVRHPVKQKDRVVFDLKARHRGTSLNEHLMQGPDLTNSLTGVLLRFREGQHAITADVQEMFHQVKVPEEDRDCLRYLWWPEGVTSKELQVFRMTSHVFGARSSPSVVNFCLRKTALDFGSMYNEEASNSIRRNFYVDNLLKAMDDEEECIKLTRDLINLCRDGGFRLNQWTSSSKQILAAIPREERDDSVAVLDLNKDELPTERALGIHWNMSIDVFTFRIVLKDKPFNRRGVLSVVASIYDPLGYLSPVTLIAKILLQEMCRRKLSWDEEMSADELVRWKTWLAQLPQLEEFQLRRSFIPPDFGDVDTLQLHHFADASQTGYGVVSYLRVVGVNGKIHCTLVIGRARVAPLKRTTIPRLELTAAAIAAQMDSKLKTELDLKLAPSVFWTDSTSVLKYLRNPTARYQTFVDNRVNLIRDTSDIMAWRYINTTANPADLASRGLSVADFLQSSLWFSGPDFLKMDETHWPTMPEDVVRGELDPDAEVKTSLVFDITKKEPTFIESIATRFSSWLKFVRTVAWKTRFIRHMQKARPYSGDSLSSAELRTAENLIWRLTQSQEYEEELSTLSKKGRSLKRSSKLIKL
ncbi:uncharacterized protein [Palaemon carinicauda]|uniref:uncharacterized protein n=1 Tax=Palaemon carinicauda TaxID=392227 RepID=UPI0035B67370